MFFPFKNYRTIEQTFNDTNAIVFTTSADVKTMVIVEPISNFDQSGSGIAFQVFSSPTIAPTSFTPEIIHFQWETGAGLPTQGIFTSNPCVLRPSTNVSIRGAAYTGRLKFHIFELPTNV